MSSVAGDVLHKRLVGEHPSVASVVNQVPHVASAPPATITNGHGVGEDEPVGYVRRMLDRYPSFPALRLPRAARA